MAALALPWLLLLLHLAAFWRTNPQYRYGWFVPPLVLLLLLPPWDPELEKVETAKKGER